MKPFLLLLACLLSGTAVPLRAQPFEGKVRYQVKVSGENVRQFTAMLPKYMEYQFQGKNVRIRSDAAMMNDMLVREGDQAVYFMMDEQKKAYRMETDPNQDAVTTQNLRVEATDDMQQIAGYRCRRYVVTATDPASGMSQTQQIWATPDLEVNKPNVGSMGLSNLMLKEIDGMPLKVVAESPLFTMEMTASVIEPGKLDAAIFELPAGYAVEKFDPSQLMKAVGR